MRRNIATIISILLIIVIFATCDANGIIGEYSSAKSDNQKLDASAKENEEVSVTNTPIACEAPISKSIAQQE